MNKLWLILGLAIFLPETVLCADDTDVLRDIAVSVSLVNQVPETGLEYLAGTGHRDLADRIKADRGFVTFETGHRLAGILSAPMEKARMQPTYAYRLAMMNSITFSCGVFDYERADATAECFLDNIDRYVANPAERAAWRHLYRSERAGYVPHLENWNQSVGLNSTQYIADAYPELDPVVRLFQLTALENGHISQIIYLAPADLDKVISEMDSLCAVLYPHLPQLPVLRRPCHLMARVCADPYATLSEQLALKDLLKKGTLDPINTLYLENSLGYFQISTGNSVMGNELIDDAWNLLLQQLAVQSRYTVLNTAHVTYGMARHALALRGMVSTDTDDDSERRRFLELAEEIEPTREGKRCRAAALGVYISQRSGQTTAFPVSDMAKTYISYVNDDPYQPYRFGSLASGYLWLGNGGEMEYATGKLRETAAMARKKGCGLEASAAYMSLANHLLTQGESGYAEALLCTAECLERSDRQDHESLCDIYATLALYHYDTGESDDALRYAALADAQRKYLYEFPWTSYTHWQVATVRAGLSDNPRQRFRELYDRATAMELPPQIMDLGERLMYMALEEGDIMKAEEYLSASFAFYSMNPAEYGGHDFANEYLNFLFNVKGDRGKWRTALSTVISMAEQDHLDLNMAFIHLLGCQAGNALGSNNMDDALYCMSVLATKSRALMAMLSEESQFARYGLQLCVVPVFVRFFTYFHYFWHNNEKNMTETQRKQFLSVYSPESLSRQTVEMLDNLIETHKKYNHDLQLTIELAGYHIRLTSLLAGIDAARAELDTLADWATRHDATELFECNTVGLRMDLARMAGDIDAWVALVDDEALWHSVDNFAGNIDEVSFKLTALTGYNLEHGDLKRAHEIAEKRFRMVRNFVETQYMQLSAPQREALSDNGTLSPFDIYRQLPVNGDARLRTLAYDASLFYKNLLLESDNAIRHAVHESGDSTQIADYERWSSIRKNTRFYQMDLTSPQTQRLLREYRALEDSISTRALDSGLLSLKRTTTAADVAQALAAHEAAIEFTADGDSYGALILRHGDKAPRFVRLISGQGLMECLEPLSSAGSGIGRKIKRIYSGTSQRGARLYRELWQPLENELQGVERIYYSPIGDLSIVALGALQDSTLTPVCERYDMRLVSSTALIASHEIKDPDGRAAQWKTMAVGDVRYERDEEHPGRNWKHLRYSSGEVQHFDSICRSAGLHPRLLTGSEASEKAVAALSGNSPSLMLVSTHGFYHNAERAARGSFYINKGLTHDGDSVSPNYAIPALKRAGLIFAGANPVWHNEATSADDNDGILTAEEIARLDLSSTRLMVLSACETGLGETTMTEGVNGLQRALKMAGVQSMILSLWEVNDKAGREFMTEFYDRLFNGEDRHAAFRNATLALKKLYPSEPANWAMFVMLD